MEQPQKKITDPHLALVKIEHWCAYQDRCQWEVRQKLYSWGLYTEAVESIIAELISRQFLDEERFARAFAGGKFRIKKWGRNKIKVELRKRFVPEKIIKLAMNEIDPDDYIDSLGALLRKRWSSEKEKNKDIRKLKVMRYAVSRGYEQDLIKDELNGIES